MGIFAVTRKRGGAYDRSRPLEEQEAWRPHADFMNALEAEGIALLAGPLEDGRDEVLLILRAGSAVEAERSLAPDPWTKMGLLETVRIAAWDVRVGTLG